MILPNDIDTEKSILSSLIMGHSFEDVADVICPEDFYAAKNRTIFEACKNIHSKKQPIDIVTIHAESKIPVDYLVEILADYPVSVSPVNSAKRIKALSVSRKIISRANEIITSAATVNEDNLVEFLDFAQSRIFSVSADISDDVATKWEDWCQSRLDQYEEMSNGKHCGVMTGFPTIDRLTGGLHGGKLIVVAARPRIGKTALALNMTRTMAKAGHVVGFFEIEMDGSDIVDRVMAGMTEINPVKLATGSLAAQDWSLIYDAADTVHKYKILLDDTGGITIGEIKRRSRRMVKAGAEIIFIDQLSKIKGGKGKGEYEQRSYIVNELMSLKKELRIPIVLLAQINRQVEGRETKRPTLGDLKSTGSLEEDADIVLLGHRPYPYTHKPEDEKKAFWEIAKHRGGSEWGIEMIWNPKTTTFYEVEKRNEGVK